MCYTILSAKYIFFSFSSLFFFSQNAQKSFLLSDTTKTDDVKPMRKIKSGKKKKKNLIILLPYKIIHLVLSTF